MESESAASAAALDALRRSQILTYTRYPRLGRWYPPAVGVLAALLVASIGIGGAAGAVGVALVDVAMVAGAVAYTRRRGTFPRLDGAPREIRRAMLWFVGVLALVAGAVAVVHRTAGWPVAAVLAFVLVTVFIAAYERRFARAALEAERNSGLFDAAP